jgi:hypothetical protein
MGSSTSKPPPAPDPKEIIGLENQYNRYNTSNPFGSTNWSTGANGHETQTTTISPEMQQAMDRAFAASATPYTKEYVPQGMDQLTSAILGKVGKNYGVSGLNTNLKSQGQSPPSANIPGQLNGGGMGSPMQMHSAMAPQGGPMGSPMQMGAQQMSPPQSGPNAAYAPFQQYMQHQGNFATTGGINPGGYGNQQSLQQLLQMFGGPGVGQIGPRTMPAGNQGS